MRRSELGGNGRGSGGLASLPGYGRRRKTALTRKKAASSASRSLARSGTGRSPPEESRIELGHGGVEHGGSGALRGLAGGELGQ